MKYVTKFMAGAVALMCVGGGVRAQIPIWDTLSTQCTRLVVDDRCEVGVTKREGVNLDFVALGGDCDPGANVYLYSGGPFAIRKNGTSYVYSSSVWQSYLANSTGWGLMLSGQTPGPISGPGYTGFQTSTMWNADHTIAVQKTYYAPSVTDSCNFIIQKSMFFGVGGPKTNVTVGEIVDWDVPANGAAPGINTAGILASKETVFQRGIGTTGCQPDDSRYAAVSFLDMYSQTELLGNQCVHSRYFYGEFAWSVDTLLKRIDTLPNSEQGDYYWNLTGAMSGLVSSNGQSDLATVLTYKYNFTLDTLTVYTVLVSVKNGTVADLNSSIDKARQFYRLHLRPGCQNWFSCCWANNPTGRRGNVDCDFAGGWDISDLSALIDYLYIRFTPLCCPEAADWNGDGRIDIEDIVRCIEYLYICFGCQPAFCD